MRYVSTVHGPVPLWRWRLRWALARQGERVRQLVCFIRGHRTIRDCDALYCIRCHTWPEEVRWV